MQWLIEAVDPIKTDPTSMSDTWKVFDNIHMLWMCIWMCPNNIPSAPDDKALGSHLEIWVTPGQQMMVKWSDWAVDPIKTDPTSMSDTWKVFGNLHMQWMWMWMCPSNITAAPIDQALGSHLENWEIPVQQMMVKCSDWSCRPNQDWSYINVRHMKGVWQPSYAVDAHLDVL